MLNLKKMAVLALISVSGMTGYAHAEQGERTGNGGNVGVCFHNSATVTRIESQNNQLSAADVADIESVQALDYLVAVSQFPPGQSAGKLILPNAGEDYKGYVTRIASRFKEVLPMLQSQILENLSAVNEQNFSHYDRAGIERIYDAGEHFYLDPLKCVIATAIRQSRSGSQVNFEFDERLFSRAQNPEALRAFLLLHETLYHWAIDRGQRTSEGTQKFIAKLIRKDSTRVDIVNGAENFGFGYYRSTTTPESNLYMSNMKSVAEPLRAVLSAEVSELMNGAARSINWTSPYSANLTPSYRFNDTDTDLSKLEYVMKSCVVDASACSSMTHDDASRAQVIADALRSSQKALDALKDDIRQVQDKIRYRESGWRVAQRELPGLQAQLVAANEKVKQAQGAFGDFFKSIQTAMPQRLALYQNWKQAFGVPAFKASVNAGVAQLQALTWVSANALAPMVHNLQCREQWLEINSPSICEIQDVLPESDLWEQAVPLPIY